uniref:Small ribosomal subunit protein mS41 SAM domain-containing protein n=1 Tax=Nelumbo nucifera TaxID=4432 RepID=A0A822YNB6_NELNU|nr:TPA_asm: hypothetical protein HUJ06_011922 [Nelumbo nucifera]
MAMVLKQILSNRKILSTSHLVPGFSRFFSKSNDYLVKVGIPEFLNGVGRGVETHVAKLDAEIGDFQKLLVTRTLKLKKLGIPCKHDLESKKMIGSGREVNGVYLLDEIPRHQGHHVSNNSSSGSELVKQIMRKLILKYTHKYRLGLWRPRMETVKSS